MKSISNVSRDKSQPNSSEGVDGRGFGIGLVNSWRLYDDANGNWEVWE